MLALAETERPRLLFSRTDLWSFPSDKLQMWSSPAPCLREGCAVTRWKSASEALTQHFEQHSPCAAQAAVQLLWSATKHSSPFTGCATCGQVAVMLIPPNLPLWLARRSEEIQVVYIIDLVQQWWLCRAWAATRFASLKQKFCKASVRKSTHILLLTSV